MSPIKRDFVEFIFLKIKCDRLLRFNLPPKLPVIKMTVSYLKICDHSIIVYITLHGNCNLIAIGISNEIFRFVCNLLPKEKKKEKKTAGL